jgi:hypothetical protein
MQALSAKEMFSKQMTQDRASSEDKFKGRDRFGVEEDEEEEEEEKEEEEEEEEAEEANDDESKDEEEL